MDELLDVARGLNRNLEALTRSTAGGGPLNAAEVQRVRAETQDQIRRLEGLRGKVPPEAEEGLRKVADHLALTLQALGDAPAAPSLAGRLLSHLIEEQWEIVGALEKRRPPRSDPPSVTHPLTVGSLIGR